MQTEDPVLSHPISLLILGLINVALAALGIVITSQMIRFGAFEVMTIAVSLICAIVCFHGAYVRWREICSRG